MEPDGTSTHVPPRRRYLWFLGALPPALVYASWVGVHLTGWAAFWWTGPVVTFVIVPLADRIVGTSTQNSPEHVSFRTQRSYRWATYLFLVQQYLALLFACWLFSGGGWVTMTFLDRLGLLATVGLIGGMGINVAHELGHKRETVERLLSKVALAQTCYGHFYVEHNRGHHARVATAEDPASARFGESLDRFVVRSMVGGLRSAWRLEHDRFTRSGRSPWTLRNDLLTGWLLSAALFTGLSLWFGIGVLPWLIAQALLGCCLLEAVNYIEHYGLRRRRLAGGRYEPVRPEHSWNSNAVLTNLFLFQLQRHSDHHAHPLRRYQLLRHTDEAPQLPAGYAEMLLLALIPPRWRRVMDPLVLAHYGGDIRRVALDEGATASRDTAAHLTAVGSTR
ncbi:alkane 1-monooxygenase [Mycolicibacterium thermoresistibile]